MSISMITNAEEFFARYEKANAESDIPAITALYADAFLFGGPAGVRSVSKSDLAKAIPMRKQHFASLGLVETRLAAVEETLLDAKYVMARTSWIMVVRTAGERKELATAATYILERTGETMAIVMQIDHQDLAAKVKELTGPDGN
jgi:ketosteroid isomerase-like protein